MNESSSLSSASIETVAEDEKPPSQIVKLKRSLSNKFSQSLPSYSIFHTSDRDKDPLPSYHPLNRSTSYEPFSKPFDNGSFSRNEGVDDNELDRNKEKFQYRAEDDFGLGTSWWINRMTKLRTYSLAPLKDPIAPGLYTRVTKAIPIDYEPSELVEVEETVPETQTPEPELPIDSTKEGDELIEEEKRPVSIKHVEFSEKYKAETYEETQMTLPVIQEFILDSYFSITVEGRKTNEYKKYVYYVFCILTAGILYLFAKWFPSLRSFLTTSQSPLAYSTHVFVNNSYGQKALINVRRSYYGKILNDVFGKQRVHECLVVEESALYPEVEESFTEEKLDDSRAETTPAAIDEGQVPEVVNNEAGLDEDGEEEDYMMYSYICQPPSNPISATHIDIQDTNSISSSIYKFEGEKPNAEDFLYYFEYRCIRFIYHPNTGRYFKNSQWESFQNVDGKKLNQGLNKALHNQRKIIFGSNLISIQKKSIFQIFFDEILHPFNIFQCLSISLWVWEQYYYYSAAIFFMSAFSLIITIVETKRNIENLKKMAMFKCRAHVLSDGKWISVSSESLVPGDIIQISQDYTDNIPCDLLLLEGDCIINESMLTGESIPVIKIPLLEEDWNKDGEDSHEISLTCEKSVLYAGTKIIRVRSPSDKPARAVVIRTGFNTIKGNLVRNMLFPRPNNFKFYKESMIFIGILAFLALIAFSFTLARFIYLKVDHRLIVMRALDLITIVVPPALTTCMAIGITFAIGRLKNKNIFCISPPRINIAGKVNLLCFDKTGTLTEDGLDLLGFHCIDIDDRSLLGTLMTNLNDVKIDKSTTTTTTEWNVDKMPPAMLTVIGMASCHTVKCVDQKYIGDPLDVKMFEFCTAWELEESTSVTIIRPRPDPTSSDNEFYSELSRYMQKTNEICIIKNFEFVPTLRRMANLVKIFKYNGVFAFVKGAPESIAEIANPSTIPENFMSVMDYYTSKGYRVIALASKYLPGYSWTKSLKLKREFIESQVSFLGLLVFENKLKSVTKNVMKELHRAKFRTVICTGDNILTALCVAKDTKIIGADDFIYLPRLFDSKAKNMEIESEANDYEEGETKVVWESISNSEYRLSSSTLHPLTLSIDDKRTSLYHQSFTIGCTGHILEYLIDHCSLEALNRVLMKCDVFARMSPDQKQRLVECFQRLEYCVGFCGDGANDCGALKAADVGLSLSEAEASVAAPFTCKVQDIRCTLDLIKEGRSALATSFSCFKFMTLYSIIEFTTVTILYYFASNMSDFQFMYIDMVIILPIAICIGRLNTSNRLTSKPPSSRLLSKRVLSSLLGQCFLQAVFQFGVFYFSINQYWFDTDKLSIIDPSSENTEGQINTVLFTFAIFQYLTVAYIFCWNVPYQISLFYNIPFMLLTLLTLVINFFFLFFPADWARSLLLLMELPVEFRLYLFLIIVIYAICALAVHYFTYRLVKLAFKASRKSKKKLKLYKKYTELLKHLEENV